jgi:hypothetical protein
MRADAKDGVERQMRAPAKRLRQNNTDGSTED